MGTPGTGGGGYLHVVEPFAGIGGIIKVPVAVSFRKWARLLSGLWAAGLRGIQRAVMSCEYTTSARVSTTRSSSPTADTRASRTSFEIYSRIVITDAQHSYDNVIDHFPA
jgi:hypothetical protein